ncbi:hypothetical protein L6258_03945 [Candidatus Parcubacteria bacterium]|nr:hypothetical protein [Candidatus Parcubacteria bacterium]
MADYFKGLADDMAGAYEDRTGRIATIQKETTHLIREFEKEDKERADGVKERADGVAKLLSDFDEAHQEMAVELKAKLTKDEGDRVQQTRVEIKERTATVAAMLADFDKAHAEMAVAMRAELAKVRPELAGAEKGRRERDQAEIKQREADTAALLKQFDEEHAKMSQELLAGLKAQEEERVKTTQAEIRERASQWKAAVAKMASVRGRKESARALAEVEEKEEKAPATEEE